MGGWVADLYTHEPDPPFLVAFKPLCARECLPLVIRRGFSSSANERNVKWTITSLFRKERKKIENWNETQCR